LDPLFVLLINKSEVSSFSNSAIETGSITGCIKEIKREFLIAEFSKIIENSTI
jgi:hypothetical protein